MIRKAILKQSASLISHIDKLLKSSSGEVDTPIIQYRPRPLTAEHLARMMKSEDVAAVVSC